MARISFSSLFKPNQPTKEPVVEAQQPPKPQQQYFFSYGAQGASSALPKAPASEQHFIKATIYKEQKVQDGAGVVLKLQEPCPQGPLTLPAGTLLYGAARFARNRLLLTLTAAQYKDQRLPVLLTCYDTDLLPGLYYEGISAWERPQEQALDKALGHTDAGLLKALGQGAVSAWKTLRKKQTATLEDGRQLYVQPKDKR